MLLTFSSSASSELQLKPGPIEEKYLQVLLREVAQGLQYLHSCKIIHRDVKGFLLFNFFLPFLFSSFLTEDLASFSLHQLRISCSLKRET